MPEVTMKKALVLLSAVCLLAACGNDDESKAESESSEQVNVLQDTQKNKEMYQEKELVNLSYEAPDFFQEDDEEDQPVQSFHGEEGSVFAMYGVTPLDVSQKEVRQGFVQQSVVGDQGMYAPESETEVTVAGKDGYRIQGTMDTDKDSFIIDVILLPNNDDSFIAYVSSIVKGNEDLSAKIMDKFIKSASLSELTDDDKKAIDQYADPLNGVDYRLDFDMPSGWVEEHHSEEPTISYSYSKNGSLATVDMWKANFDIIDKDARRDFVDKLGTNIGSMDIQKESETKIDGEKAYRYDADFTAQGVPGKGAIVISEKDGLMVSYMIIAVQDGGMDYNHELGQMLDQATFVEQDK